MREIDPILSEFYFLSLKGHSQPKDRVKMTFGGMWMLTTGQVTIKNKHLESQKLPL